MLHDAASLDSHAHHITPAPLLIIVGTSALSGVIESVSEAAGVDAAAAGSVPLEAAPGDARAAGPPAQRRKQACHTQVRMKPQR